MLVAVVTAPLTEHALLYKLVSGTLADTTIFVACRCCFEEPVLRQLQRTGPAARRRAYSDSQRGDVLLAISEGAVVEHISVVHPVADA